MAFVYILTDDEGSTTIDTDDLTESGAAELCEDGEFVSYIKQHVSDTDYVKGWFYYNDEEDHLDACTYVFNSVEQMSEYQERNDMSGHFACDRYELYVNGELSSTVRVDERISTVNGWGLDPQGYEDD